MTVPGAATDTDTTPAKLSEKKAADDRLGTFAYTLKLLSREERSAIYQALKGQSGGRALKADIGTKLPLGIELRPVPDELIVRVPQTRGYGYMVAGDTVLLVSPLTRAVVGVFPPIVSSIADTFEHFAARNPDALKKEGDDAMNPHRMRIEEDIFTMPPALLTVVPRTLAN